MQRYLIVLGRCAEKQRKFTHTHTRKWHENHTHTHTHIGARVACVSQCAQGAKGYAPWNPCAFNVEKWVCEHVVYATNCHAPPPLPLLHFVAPFTSALHFVCAAKQFGVWNGSAQWRGPHSQLEFIQHFSKVAFQLHCCCCWCCCCCSSIYALDSLAAAAAKSLSVHMCVCCFLLACVFAAFATYNWSKLVLSGFSILRCGQQRPRLFRLFHCNWKEKQS